MTPISPDALLESLQWRYATKVFDPQKTIPATSIQAIEESLALSPSSFGIQPWKFIVVTDPEIKAALLPHSWNQTQVIDCSHLVVLCAKEQTSESDIQRLLKCIADRRNVELESLSDYAAMMSGFIKRMDPEQSIAWAKNQVYIALGQLMTSAAVLGIDACPMEGICPAEYDRILGLDQAPASERYLTTVACPMGYRSADDKYAQLAKVRFPTSEVIDHH
ncbi:NAD(P)H-dependent oxidoreductase [Verrucomicrobiaceae bacterium N1E253]|uniref:NAD(P)H-dependent oxidoreductase n=1 Tax=Oceaniferula marina TaxID=2748318 RepID=A0A851GNY0_9BACT|nr:NAD(P)H-dependent oxidoreductase [Oceaniferula marina]NWK56737.1 NAD(P)H-dependent oxidoreductase [Oceaniferula marina]